MIILNRQWRLKLLFCGLLLCIFSTNVLAEEDDFFINGNNVNIRSGAGTNFQVITQGQLAEKVTVLKEKDPWFKIQFTERDVVGWIHKALILRKKKEIASPDPVEPKGQGDSITKDKQLSDGSVYSGPTKEEQPHGEGKLIQPDGSIYTGAFVVGEFSGHGTFLFPNGIQYIGNFINNTMNGKGKMSIPNTLTYTGNFKDGHYHGNGVVLFDNGNKYEGEFKNSQFNGTGTYTFADGEEMTGEWKEGKILKAE